MIAGAPLALAIRSKSNCRFDLVSLGEVMLRLDPSEERIATTRSFRAWEGGGEYNVARGLRRCFRLDTAIVTALVDNPVGRLLEDLMNQGGVDQRYVQWVTDDGVGRTVRNGLNFTERGFGLRAPLGCSDRGNSAASKIRRGEIDWEAIFAGDGVRWFHCGGVFSALSETTGEAAVEAMKAARAAGTITSYDLNYRPSLWKTIGGKQRAAEVNTAAVEYVDVLLGNEEDFSAALGFDRGEAEDDLLDLDPDSYRAMLGKVKQRFPNVKVAAVTLRQARSATRNDWTAVCLADDGFHAGQALYALEVFDRVGGGDSFASGFIYGLLTGDSIDTALSYGIAHGALAMTTPGDTSMATLDDVLRAMRGDAVRVSR